ncbi:CheR family methyltransferase [Spirosoma aerophilum]
MSDQHPPDVAVPVVAIGASSGGLEAFSDLLTSLSPTTGLAYVYIQHFNSGPENDLTAILARTTSMPVVEAEHLVKIEPNHVYIIPSDKNMEIVDGVITLMPRRLKAEPDSETADQPPVHLPIDQFLISLAERQKDGAVGIILSGMAQDGVLGLKAIKVAGGITFAQDASARFQNMPQSAIAEGVVDMILSPAGMAGELERLSQQSIIFQRTALADLQRAADTDALSDAPYADDEDLREIIQLLRNIIGVDFGQYKMTTIRRRIIRRMVLYKLDTLNAYAQYLLQNPSEVRLLYNDLLINVTSFFRDEETMEFLKTTIFPQLIRQKSDHQPIRIWIPGCSTGQEVYSLAMLLLEALDELRTVRDIQIFATDLSEIAITRARQGTYTLSEVTNIPPRRLARFFTKGEGLFVISKLIRDMCVFAPHNIFKDPPFSRIDLVSCRNLLIYLNTVLQRKALITFHYALNPTGFLLLGKSETVSASVALFTPVDKNHKVFSRKNERSVSATINLPLVDWKDTQPVGRVSDPVAQETRFKNQTNKARKAVTDLDKVVDQVLLSHYVPASVVVDQELDIIQFRGETSLFLEHTSGKASLNLMKMARPTLALEIRTAVHKCRKTGQRIRREGLELVVNDKKYRVALEVMPLSDGAAGRLFLILFQDMGLVNAGDTLPGDEHNGRVRQLEEELVLVREEMRAIIEEHEVANEELQSANEEIVSSNEELQSINEELETSKEEIESSNEELQAINHELQLRNDQLTEAYMYAEAIFATIREATLILDKDLRVKSANLAFYQTFRLSEAETVGYLIYEIGNRQWNIPRLRELLEEVIQKDAFIRGFEVKHQFPNAGEKLMLVHARRVIHQQRQEAILLAIEDVTEQRQVQQLLEERQAWFHDIIDNAPALIWVAGPDGQYNFFNKAWLDYTGRTLDGQKGQVWTQAIHAEDRKDYIATYLASFNARVAYQAEYRLKRNDGEYRWMMENARPTFGADGAFTGYIGTCAEVHTQKSLNQELDNRVQERTQELTQANQELVHTAENLQAVLNTSPASVGLLKAVKTEQGEVVNFKVIVCNLKFAQMVHQPIRQVTGKLATELAPALWQEETLDQLRQVYESGKSAYREQHDFLDRQDRWLGMSINRQDDGVILTGLDITALKHAELQQDRWLQELARSQQTMQDLEQMRRYVRERGEFLRTTSHDLRGSFGVIQGAAALLNLMDTKEEREQMLSMLNRNLSQVTDLLTQLLDYSRLESGQEQVFHQAFDAADLLRELGSSLEPSAGEKGLKLLITGPQSLPVQGDMVKVRRIAQNLLLNAISYTPAGEVTLSWGKNDEANGWQFSVQDTGPGLPEQSLRQLRNDEGGTRTLPNRQSSTFGASGEGIGLSIVRQLSNLLRATVEVTSEPGSGTLIQVFFH